MADELCLAVVNRRSGQTYDIYAGRPSILGNPFSHTFGTRTSVKMRSRDEAVERYESYAWERMQTDLEFREALLACKGRRVACWCHPLNCHIRAISRLILRWEQEHA